MSHPDPARYARFYAPLAILAFVMLFIEPFRDTFDPATNTVVHYGTLFHMANTAGGAPALLAIALIVTLIGLLVCAGAGFGGGWAASSIATLGLLLMGLLMLKPNTSPVPRLTSLGSAAVALDAVIVAVSVAHLGHFTVSLVCRRPRPGPLESGP